MLRQLAIISVVVASGLLSPTLGAQHSQVSVPLKIDRTDCGDKGRGKVWLINSGRLPIVAWALRVSPESSGQTLITQFEMVDTYRSAPVAPGLSNDNNGPILPGHTRVYDFDYSPTPGTVSCSVQVGMVAFDDSTFQGEPTLAMHLQRMRLEDVQSDSYWADALARALATGTDQQLVASLKTSIRAGETQPFAGKAKHLFNTRLVGQEVNAPHGPDRARLERLLAQTKERIRQASRPLVPRALK